MSTRTLQADGTASTETKSTRAEQHGDERTAEREVCPECSGRIAPDASPGETVCTDCGLVVDESAVDRGPEWRAFDAGECNSKSRVGAPTTKLLHDEGLSSVIGWQDRDASGRAVLAPAPADAATAHVGRALSHS